MRPYTLTIPEVLAALDGKLVTVASNPQDRRSRGGNDTLARSPFGEGSRFYGRETWCLLPGSDGDPDVVCYFADDGTRVVKSNDRLGEDAGCPAAYMRDEANDPWQPAHLMPARLSRIRFQTGAPRLEVQRDQQVWVADVKVTLQ